MRVNDLPEPNKDILHEVERLLKESGRSSLNQSTSLCARSVSPRRVLHGYSARMGSTHGKSVLTNVVLTVVSFTWLRNKLNEGGEKDPESRMSKWRRRLSSSTLQVVSWILSDNGFRRWWWFAFIHFAVATIWLWLSTDQVITVPCNSLSDGKLTCKIAEVPLA